MSAGLKNEFETTMVNEPSVFELLRFDYTFIRVNWEANQESSILNNFQCATLLCTWELNFTESYKLLHNL